MARRPTRGRGTVAGSNTNLPYFAQRDKKGNYDEKSKTPTSRGVNQDIPIVKDGQPRETGRTGGMGHHQHSATSGFRRRAQAASQNKQAWDASRWVHTSPLKGSAGPQGPVLGTKPKAPRGGRKR